MNKPRSDVHTLCLGKAAKYFVQDTNAASSHLFPAYVETSRQNIIWKLPKYQRGPCPFSFSFVCHEGTHRDCGVDSCFYCRLLEIINGGRNADVAQIQKLSSRI